MGTYTDLLARSCSEHGVFWDIRDDVQRSLLLLKCQADHRVHDDLVCDVEPGLFHRFAGGALVLGFVGIDLASREAPG